MNQEGPTGLSRRGLFTGLGAGVAIVWVTPAITRVAIASAAVSHEPDAGGDGDVLDDQHPADQSAGVSSTTEVLSGDLPRTGSDNLLQLVGAGAVLIGTGGSLTRLARRRRKRRAAAEAALPRQADHPPRGSEELDVAQREVPAIALRWRLGPDGPLDERRATAGCRSHAVGGMEPQTEHDVCACAGQDVGQQPKA